MLNPNSPNNPMMQMRTAAVMAGIMIGTDYIDPKSKDIRTYYSRYAGARYYFADGGIATFFGGEYQVDAANPDNALRVKELEYVVRQSQPIFTPEKVKMVRSDSKKLREVGNSMGGTDEEVIDEQDQPRPSLGGVGMVNSQSLVNLAADSNAK